MKADKATTVDDALSEAGSLDAAAETDVFDDLHAERFEATDLLVGFAAKKVEGAYPNGVAFCIGVGDAPGPGDPDPEDLEEAQDGGLVPAFNDGGGNSDEVVGMGGYRMGKSEADCSGVEEHIGIGEKEVVGAGLPSGKGHGVGFAEPTGRQFGDVEGAESFRVFGSYCVNDRAGLVGAAVVDGDYLKVRVVLLEKRVEGGTDVCGLVACGYDHGNRWRTFWGDVVPGENQIGNARKAEGGSDNFPEPGDGDQPGQELKDEL